MTVYSIVVLFVSFCSSHLLNDPRYLARTSPEPALTPDFSNKPLLKKSHDIHAGGYVEPHATTSSG